MKILNAIIIKSKRVFMFAGGAVYLNYIYINTSLIFFNSLMSLHNRELSIFCIFREKHRGDTIQVCNYSFVCNIAYSSINYFVVVTKN